MVADLIIAAELTRRALFTGAASGAVAPSALADTAPAYIPVSDKAQPNGVASLDADGHIYVDQIPPGLATLDADGHVYESQLPPALALHDDLVFNVRDHGAAGDGVQDDLPAIRATIAAATAHGGGVVWFPVGIYAISAPIGDTSTGLSNLTLAGAGSQIATIRATTNAPILTGIWYSCTVVNLVLDANGQGAPCISAHLDKTHLERLWLLNWNGFGMTLNDGTFSDDGGLLNVISHCNIQQNTGTGISTGYRFYDSWISDNNIGASYADLSLEGGPVRVLGNHLDGSPTYNIEFRGNKRIVVSNNILEGSRKQSIVYRMPPWLTSDKPQIQIIGNTFSNGGKLAQNVYPAISITGVSSAARTEGFTVTGNTFACDDVGAGWTYIIEAQFARTIAAVGNQWKEGHMATQPCRFVTCSNTEVIGNHADNVVKTT
ncbi:right-handed parallel beta-helix repeat-containing protein [Subtercola boreus]|uniref:right-handed parallel beta-helix repeat-containing protein n=1 Tax=Subtercola boreus TaxID=120213 RepID=UPI0011523EAA|nr:right-handed parallel beta-helix repeat-containing protein [Subtercola boreus]